MPLRPDTAQKLHKLYLAKGVSATTAIEGNSLSEADVLKAVEGKLKVPPSKEYLKQEVDNMIGACNAIGEQIMKGVVPTLLPAVIKDYNKRILDKLPAKKDVVPGEIRGHSVVVGNVYRGAPAEDCTHLLERLCDWLNGPDFKAPAGAEIFYRS